MTSLRCPASPQLAVWLSSSRDIERQLAGLCKDMNNLVGAGRFSFVYFFEINATIMKE